VLPATQAEPTEPPPANPAIAPQPIGDRRSYGLADASIRQRFGLERPPATPAATVPSPAEAQPAAATPDDHADLGQLLRELELRPTLNARRSPPGAPEQWTEIPITSRVYLSVRGLPEEDTVIAESLARLLKRALRTRPTVA
jgi:hypothetical protein